MDELKLIKKRYGEHMMHLCRRIFPTILNEEGKLINILDSTFGHPKYLYDDIKDKIDVFKDLIYYIYDSTNEKVLSKENPFELLDKAGYTLYECKNEHDIARFKKYYRSDEELCTFRDNRLDYCHVFFAVKKNVDEIKRNNFKSPKREDEYGVSVISLQFTKGKVNTLSIKNRYNHTVKNPDCTFNNDLENIIPGLTYSFEKYYGFNINQNYSVDLNLNYVRANDLKYYKYNMEIGNIYYCPDNIIVKNGEVIKKFADKEKYLLMDYFLLNLQKIKEHNIDSKSVVPYSRLIKDSFCDDLKNFDDISIIKEKDIKIIKLFKNNTKIYIKLDRYNNIIGYKNDEIKNIKDNFLKYNKKLKEINIDSVIYIGNNFLKNNNTLSSVILPSVLRIGDDFLSNCSNMNSVDLKKVVEIGHNFLRGAKKIQYINAPILKKIGDNFVQAGGDLKVIVLPSVVTVGHSFLAGCVNLELISMPSLEKTGVHFCYNNINVSNINFSNLKELRDGFFCINTKLKKIKLDNVVKIGSNCLCLNQCENIVLNNVKEVSHCFMKKNRLAKHISMKNLEVVGNDFFNENDFVSNISFENLKTIGNNFFARNNNVKIVYLPNCQKVGNRFLYMVDEVEELIMPNLETVGHDFMYRGDGLSKLYVPNLKCVGANFLFGNVCLKEASFPSLEDMGAYFLDNNNNLESIYLPKMDVNFISSSFYDKIKNMCDIDKCIIKGKKW